MPDPAIRTKAEEMFVELGFSMDTILSMLGGEVSRKTLYNWRKEDDWENKRRGKAATNKTRRERIEAQIDRALDELEVKYDPKLVFAIGKLIAALKATNTFEFTEEKTGKVEEKKKGITPETLKEIEEKLFGRPQEGSRE